jgi:formylglycine-generating enzyme
VVAAFVLGAAIVGIAGARLSFREAPCAFGFTRFGTRCCPSDKSPTGFGPGVCAFDPVTSCPSPLVVGPHGCEARANDAVLVPATTVVIGPSDWEAEGRVAPRTIKTEAFRLDRLEASVGQVCASRALANQSCGKIDLARAAANVTLREARAFCKERNGRLPTEDEWLAAAAGDKPRRYPWGDTGAVCRRAAWGLRSGPCGEGAEGPDTVGAHPDGATPLGIHDLAGNVAEWVEIGACSEDSGECIAVVRGGAWDAALATELRTWLRREVSSEAREATIGFRCAYPGVP